MAADLPPHDHAGRRARLRERLGDAGVAALVVTAPPNVRYLTGFTGSNGQVLICTEGLDLLITDARYEGRAAVESPDLDVALDRDWIGRATEQAVELGVERLGFEDDAVTHRHGVELQTRLGEQGRGAIACRGLVEGLRRVKDDAELTRLERACELTDQAWTALLEHVEAGLTERAVARFLDRTVEDLGADAVSFPTIVASGPNSAIPHHEPTDRELQRGDLLKVDFGAEVGGYHADMTRTVAIGQPSDEMGRIHELVQRAQQAGVDAATPGTEASVVHDACRDILAGDGHAEHFLHGTGHGVGLEIHEAPAVSRESSDSLQPGNVITVEPGVYLAGVGGVRIEDTVVITSGGPPRRLTNSPHGLIRL